MLKAEGRPGGFTVPDALTGEYRFFRSSMPTFYVRGVRVSEHEYALYISGLGACSMLPRDAGGKASQ